MELRKLTSLLSMLRSVWLCPYSTLIYINLIFVISLFISFIIIIINSKLCNTNLKSLSICLVQLV